MKKIAIIIVCLLLLAGCNDGKADGDTLQNEPSLTESNAPETYEGELTLEFSFGTRTGMYSGEVNSDGLPNGAGTFECQSSGWTFAGEWDSGHWNGTGITKWNDGTTYDGEYQNDAIQGDGIYTFPDGNVISGKFANGAPSGNCTLAFTNGISFIGQFEDFLNATGKIEDENGSSRDASIVNGELVIVPLNDFFNDEQRQEKFNALYKSYQYSALTDYVNMYISENEIEPSDSAYAILDLITPALEYENKWIIDFDEFDSEYVLAFSGADSITTDNSVAVSIKGTGLDIKIGFHKNGWLFFDHIALSIDGEQVYTASVKSYDCTRNVISGNTIEEYCKCSFYDSVLEQLGSAETVILRFSNEDSGEVYDHTLTKDEIDALYCGLLLRVNNRELSNLIYRYNNPK